MTKKQTTAEVFAPRKAIVARKGIDARAWFYSQSFNGRSESMSKENMNHAAIMAELFDLGETGSAKLQGRDLFTRREENCNWLYVGTVGDVAAAQELMEHYYSADGYFEKGAQ